jgi:site-specific DNA recombinase
MAISTFAKSEETAAFYQIIEAEADVVRLVYERYTIEHLSIGAITRLLNKQGVPTRKRISRWERSTVWAMLRNPARLLWQGGDEPTSARDATTAHA